MFAFNAAACYMRAIHHYNQIALLSRSKLVSHVFEMHRNWHRLRFSVLDLRVLSVGIVVLCALCPYERKHFS